MRRAVVPRPDRRGVTASVLLALLAGCSPFVGHGPVVDPGWSGGITAGAAFGLDCEPHGERRPDGTSTDECPARVRLSNLQLEARRSWIPKYASQPAYSAGIQIPLAIGITGLYMPFGVDAYVQLPPREARLARGVGLLVHPFQVAPYVQLGRADAQGRGWHTTQALLLRDDPEEAFEVIRREWSLYWVPSLSFDLPLDWKEDRTSYSGNWRVHLMGALGYGDCPESTQGCGEPGFDWWAAVGLTLDIYAPLRRSAQ